MVQVMSAQAEQAAGPSVAPPASAPPSPLLILLDLARRARKAATTAELQFMAVNDSHALAAFRQSALWFEGRGVASLSGVVQIEANAPYVRWLSEVCAHLSKEQPKPGPLSAEALPSPLADEWAEWIPEHALWIPWTAGSRPGEAPGGLLFARDVPWTPPEIGLLVEWIDLWQHAWRARFEMAPFSVQKVGWRLSTLWSELKTKKQKGWRPNWLGWLVLLSVLGAVPVPLTVLAPAELVPVQPYMVRAPLDGVIAEFSVQPNQTVTEGQPLFGFDEALIRSKLDIARQELATTQAEYRQNSALALRDDKARFTLAGLMGRIEEKRAEAAYLAGQLRRARVVAPRSGVVLFDDPSEWIGKPVSTGERIMRIASIEDVEIEAWLPLGDAIALTPGATVKLYLNASPLDPVTAKLRYMAHDAVQRPDGVYAYRVRATLDGPTAHRVGLTGSARLSGESVPLAFWLLRRPLAVLRVRLGL